MCTITYYLRRLKDNGGQVQGSLCVRLIYRRKVRNLSLGLRLYEAEWDASTQNIIHPVLYDSR
ncbi:hypothetical protein D0T84_22520, partial [Dysgonomonas sp. 521]